MRSDGSGETPEAYVNCEQYCVVLVAIYLCSFLLPPQTLVSGFALLGAGIVSLKCRTSEFRALELVLVLFMLQRTIACLFSVSPELSFPLLIPSLEGVVLFLALRQVSLPLATEVALRSALVAGFVLMLYILLMSGMCAGLSPQELVSRSGVRLVVPNDTVYFALLGVLGIRTKAFVRRYQEVGYFTLGLSLAIVLESRLATMCFLAGIVISLATNRNYQYLKAIMLTSSLMTPVVAGFFYLIDKPLTGIEQRALLWDFAIREAVQNGYVLVGAGPGTFGLFYELENLEGRFVDQRQMDWPHNLVVESFFEQGAVGVILLLIALGVGLKVSLSSERTKSLLFDVPFACCILLEASFQRVWLCTYVALHLGFLICSRSSDGHRA